MLVATKTLALKEPAHTQAMELLTEERVTVALAAHFPRGDKRTALSAVIGKDRFGQHRTRQIPKEGTVAVAVDEAHHILEKYGQTSPFMAIGPDGKGLRPERRSYVYEVALPQNDEITLRVASDGQLASVNGIKFIRPVPPEIDDAGFEVTPFAGNDDDDGGEEIDLSDDGN